MAEKTLKTRIINKHGTEAEWSTPSAKNFVPKEGEIIIYEKDSSHSAPRFKVGDGTTKVGSLPFCDARTAQNTQHSLTITYPTASGSSSTTSVTFNGDATKTVTIPTIAGPKGDKGDTGGQGPIGKTGPQGPRGVSISSISGTHKPGDEAKSTYTVNLSNSTSAGTFTVQNGSKGSTGATGNGISSISNVSVSTADSGTSTYRINMTNGTTKDFSVKNGSKGSTGSRGPRGFKPVFTLLSNGDLYVKYVE